MHVSYDAILTILWWGPKLDKSFNPVFRTFGSSLYFSIFSSSVQIVHVLCYCVDCSTVHGSEYSFGAHEHPSSGVFEVEPKNCPGFIYRCTVFIGHTTLNPLEFREFIQRMASEYHGDTYHLISKNCNHFTDDLSTRLTGKPIPGWVNRLARLGNKTCAPLYIVFESFCWFITSKKYTTWAVQCTKLYVIKIVQGTQKFIL